MSVTKRITAEWGSQLDLRNVEHLDLARIRSTLAALDPPPALLVRPEQHKRLVRLLAPADEHPRVDIERRRAEGSHVPPLLARGVVPERERKAFEEAEAQAATEDIAAAKAEAARLNAEAREAEASKVDELPPDDAARPAEVAAEAPADALEEPAKDEPIAYDESTRHVGWLQGAPVYVDPEG